MCHLFGLHRARIRVDDLIYVAEVVKIGAELRGERRLVYELRGDVALRIPADGAGADGGVVRFERGLCHGVCAVVRALVGVLAGRGVPVVAGVVAPFLRKGVAVSAPDKPEGAGGA